jgi:hypothetical protein
MSPRERETLPKNGSFNSVADILLINETEGVAKATQSNTGDARINRKTVRFGSIERREYNRVVGDHPDVRVGPPLSFSWEYGVLPSVNIDEYEHSKLEKVSTQRSSGLRRMSSITRKNMLRTLFEVSEEEILAAEREVQRIHKQREQSMKQSEASAVVESTMRRAGRKLRKSFGKAVLAMAAIPASPYSVQAY